MARIESAVLRGALAGGCGTAVMTMMMRKVAPRVAPESMRPEEFVPKTAVKWAERRAGHPEALSDRQEMRAAMGAHFGYGSGMGAAYGLLRERMDGVPAPMAGALFGLAVWAISFEGWMPALGVIEAPHEQPPARRPLPILAHVMYGATTALAYEALG